jgi:hypothetical protein
MFNPFRSRGNGGMIVGHEVPYLNTTGALNYLAEYIRPDIIVVSKLLRMRFPKGYKICVRNIPRYIQGTKYLD